MVRKRLGDLVVRLCVSLWRFTHYSSLSRRTADSRWTGLALRAKVLMAFSFGRCNTALVLLATLDQQLERDTFLVMAAATVIERWRFAVRRDLRTVRKLLRRIRHSQRLADINLFGRRTPARMLEYVERRDRDRGPVQMPIYVTPAAFDGRHVEPLEDGESVMLAVTTDVSLRGVGFTHDEPFQADYAIVTFDLLNEDPVSLLLEVRWSNLERCNSYLSGGGFLGITETSSF